MAETLADRAKQLIADFEHAAANNAPVTPVMLQTMRDIVGEAMANSAATALALAKATIQTQRAGEIAKRVQAEAVDIAASVGSLAGAG